MKTREIEKYLTKSFPAFEQIDYMQGNKERKYFRGYTKRGVTHILEVIDDIQKGVRVMVYRYKEVLEINEAR